MLAAAKKTLDETSGVKITLSTNDLPNGVTGITSAEGTGVHPSAFEGTFKLSVSGLPADAEVIAVDGKTYAKNSLLLPDWTEIDPGDYGAPDPAKLMDPDGGFSGLLAAAEDVEAGDSVRGGEDNKEILTEYTGTISSDAVEALIPTAEGDFDVHLHDQRRRRAARGRAQGRLLRRGRGRGHLHAHPRRLRHREGDHRAVSGTAVARSPRLLLTLAAVAVAFAAADTYVVVLALPEMMGSVGIPIDQLQRAAPIVSGFLLGYVAMLPLIGRIADLRGRLPVLTAALVVFAVGSLVTALAYDLPSMVVGRFLQGVGGGGLVPATLALVADLYPVERRGVPLGIVSAVQELGSVIGPLFGAVVLALADWPAIFLINLAVGLVLAAAIRATSARAVDPSATVARSARQRLTRDHRTTAAAWTSSELVLLLITLVFGAIVFIRPPEPGPRPDLGRVLHPVRRRRPLAHAGRRGADGRPGAVPGALRHREAAAGRPARLGPQRPGGRPHRRPVPRDRPGRRDPGLRHRRPGRAGLLRPGALVPPRLGDRDRRVRPPPASRRGAAAPPRRAAAYAGLGRGRRELLRRRGADRRAHRHPDLRPDHHLPDRLAS